MEKREVIVDTCFLHKLSSEGESPENIKRILRELDFVPVAHPYIVEHELKIHSYLKEMLEEQYIREISYEEFLGDEYVTISYESYFEMLYEDLRILLEASNSVKKIPKLCLRGQQTIYNTHMSGSSMGDVHMILMAAFMQLPIVLTEDSDIAILRDIAHRRMSLGGYSLHIYNGVDLVKQIAQRTECSITKKELEKILDQMGERRSRTDVRQVWNASHTV